MTKVIGGGVGEKAGRIPHRYLPDTEVIGPSTCPILHRWTLIPWGEHTDGPGRKGSGRPKPKAKLLLHHFMPHADDRDVHDHPRPFITFVLRGSYDDLRRCPRCFGTGRRDMGPWCLNGWHCEVCDGEGIVLNERMKIGMIRYRPAKHSHRTKVGPKGCWTIVLMGPIQRDWGFWRGRTWFQWRDYERKFGLAFRCEDDE